MTGARITKEMIYARKAWVEELSKLDLEIEETNFGWLLYRNIRNGKLKQIAFGQNKAEFFRQLQMCYEILLSMEELKQREASIVSKER
jgi:hypothetical protein